MIDKKSKQAARLAVAAALLAAGTLAAPAAFAQASGLTVTKDPVTGQLRAPTAEEAQALRQAADKGRTGQAAAQPRGLLTGRVNPQPVMHANGTVEQELDESSQSFSVAVRKPDGSIETACVTGADAAQAIVSGKKSLRKTAKVHGHEHK